MRESLIPTALKPTQTAFLAWSVSSVIVSLSTFAVILWGRAAPGLTLLLILALTLHIRESVSLYTTLIRRRRFIARSLPSLVDGEIDRQVQAAREVQREKREAKAKKIQREPINLREWVNLRSAGGIGFIYVLKDTEISQSYKIGKTYRPNDRMKKFAVQLPFEVELVHVIACDNANLVERQLHRRFAKKRLRGEWFALDPDDLGWLKSQNEMSAKEPMP